MRERAFSGPGLYKAIRGHRDPKISGTATWTTRSFVWGERIPAGSLVWVERELREGEPGSHLRGVIVYVLDGEAERFNRPSELCTSVKWLEPA